MTFSEVVAGISAQSVTLTRVSNGATVAATVTTTGGGTVATINPAANLAANVQYRVTVTGGPAAIRDLAGNRLTTRSWTFTTGAAL